ncbi:MAG: cytochrome c3 family protein [Pseudomonadota bacterium]
MLYMRTLKTHIGTFFFLLIIPLFFCVPPAMGGTYTSSAHGSSSYGVDRTSTGIYATGHCAHCHEQHASINGAEPAPSGGPSGFCLLADNFSQVSTGPYTESANACFYCHTSIGSLQNGGITNNDYSATFGDASTSVTGIMQAFNQASYHNLNDILDFATGVWSSTFTNDSNPCSGCHNVHIAKRNKANPGDPTYTAISKPSDHGNLWGDGDPGERMTAPGYGVDYQPPYYSSPNLEPDGVSSDRATQAGKTPDYNTFCQDCHSYDMSAYGLSNTPIDWETTGDKHGKRDADVHIDMDLPYVAGAGSLGYVLSCTDCHEPHGSPNTFLIRREVNGTALGGTITTNTLDWKYICTQCHMDDADADDAGLYPTGAMKWEPPAVGQFQYIHHVGGSPDAPYSLSMCKNCHVGGMDRDPIPCANCHNHGDTDAWAPIYETGRRTF